MNIYVQRANIVPISSVCDFEIHRRRRPNRQRVAFADVNATVNAVIGAWGPNSCEQRHHGLAIRLVTALGGRLHAIRLHWWIATVDRCLATRARLYRPRCRYKVRTGVQGHFMAIGILRVKVEPHCSYSVACHKML